MTKTATPQPVRSADGRTEPVKGRLLEDPTLFGLEPWL